MGKLLGLLLGAACLFGAAYVYLKQGAGSSPTATSAPKRTLDNVRGAAARIEADDERRNQEMLRKTEGP